jgi:hypothetical protein
LFAWQVHWLPHWQLGLHWQALAFAADWQPHWQDGPVQDLHWQGEGVAWFMVNSYRVE